MDEKNYNNFKQNYDDFRDKLKKNINNTYKSLFVQNSEDCYLIEESWINTIINSSNNYYNYVKSFKNKIFIPEKVPTFINDFESIINYLKNEKKLKLINKNLIDSLNYDENYLIHYYLYIIIK